MNGSSVCEYLNISKKSSDVCGRLSNCWNEETSKSHIRAERLDSCWSTSGD